MKIFFCACGTKVAPDQYRCDQCGDAPREWISPDVVVTRHRGLIKFLGIDSESIPVLSHATEQELKGKNVLGVLPLSLASVCKTVTEAVLRLTPELRGRELTSSEVGKIFGGLRTYKVIAQ